MIHDFLSFYIVVSKCEERKVKALYGRSRVTLTSLHHCSRACGGILPRWFKVVQT